MLRKRSAPMKDKLIFRWGGIRTLPAIADLSADLHVGSMITRVYARPT